jgi:polyhydroxyalkanoate synthesis regulator phasin
MNADDVRKVLDSVFEKMTPAKAQEIAKGLLGEDRREQAQKLAGDLMETAQRNRDRVKKLVSREVASQVKSMGVATQDDVDALKRRVRDLERETGSSGAKRSTRTAKKPSTAAKKTAAAAKRSAASSSSTAPSSSAGSSSDDSTSGSSSGSSSGA